jgi:hypothetical protein
MGVISPKNPSAVSKILFIFLVILLSPILIIAVLLYVLWGIVLSLAIWLTWRKKIALFVYSDRPIWKEYIEREILPYIQDRAVILNWSERRSWKPSLAVSAFRYFSGYRNFNPLGIVFRPFRLVRTYRFFEAFREFKWGDPRNVEKVKSELFEALGI